MIIGRFNDERDAASVAAKIVVGRKRSIG